MDAIEAVPSSLADLREVSLLELVTLSSEAVDEALYRIPVKVPVVASSKFNSNI